MGLMNALMGNASEVEAQQIATEYARVLAPGETVERAYQLFRDLFVFTNRRLILVDRQGLTGAKVEYHSIPYRSITHFSIETAGHFDLDAELKIWISSTHEPVAKRFNKKLDIYELQSVLASYVAR
ncbi:MAG TPA: PH domain-containing protein [Longimicrobiales bacterium]